MIVRAAAVLLLALAWSLAYAGGPLTALWEITGGKPGAQPIRTFIECEPELDDYCAKLFRGSSELVGERSTSRGSEADVADGATYRVLIRLPGSAMEQEWIWTGTLRGAPEEFRRWKELVEESRALEEYPAFAPDGIK